MGLSFYVLDEYRVGVHCDVCCNPLGEHFVTYGPSDLKPFSFFLFYICYNCTPLFVKNYNK